MSEFATPTVDPMEPLTLPIPARYANWVTQQIAIRIPNDQLQALDDAVKAGSFESRADGVRQGLNRLLNELREQEIARQYREAYARHPDDPALGEAGAKLLAEAFRREEDQSS